MPSPNKECMLTTLNYIENHHSRMNLPGKPIIGSNQPLFELAMDTREIMKMDVGAVLGNFHTQMSFLGSIGYVLTRSGFGEALELIFGDKTVQSIFKGKNYARSMRAHGLLATTLKKMLVNEFPVDKMYATSDMLDISYSIIKNTDSPLDLVALRQSPVVIRFSDVLENSK